MNCPNCNVELVLQLTVVPPPNSEPLAPVDAPADAPVEPTADPVVEPAAPAPESEPTNVIVATNTS